MRIAYIIHGLYNSAGMERILTEKANSLAMDYGHDVTIITSEQRGRPAYFPLDPKVRTHDIGVNYHLPLFRRRLEQYLKDLKPDVTVSLCGGEIHSLARLRDGSVKVAELHFSHERYYFRQGKGWIHDLIARRKTAALEKAARTLAGFVVLTKADLEVWKTITPNAVQIYNFIPSRPETLAKLDSKKCICASRLIPSKNLGEMIMAWKEVASKHPDWTLDIYGRGNQEKKLRALITREGLEGKVLIHKPVKNITEKLLESSCYLFTSLNEGMGLALVEAAAAGLPAVSYDCKCGPSEIIEEGKTGYLVKEHDVHGFAEKVCRIIEDEGLRKSMGAAASKSSARFSKPAIMRQWDTYLRKLAE